MLKLSNRLDIERLIAKRLRQLQAQVAGIAGGITIANRGSVYAQTPVSTQGAGGPTIVGLIQTTVQGSGIFRLSAKGNALTVAGDQSRWDVQTQTGAGAVHTTGGGSTGVSNGIIPPGGLALFSNSVVPGTGIVITTGGGAQIQSLVSTEIVTIGAGATLEDKFSMSGIFANGNNGPFGPAGTNVFLTLLYTNNTANRQLSNILLGLEEV